MKTLRILLTDDNPTTFQAVHEATGDFALCLPEYDRTVRFAIDKVATQADAVHRLETVPPHIVLLGENRPDASRTNFLELIRQRYADVDSIVLMKDAYGEAALEAIRHGATDVLALPLMASELRVALGRAAQRSLKRDQQERQERRQCANRCEALNVLAHEMKAPLAAVEGYLDLLQKGLGDGPQREHMIARCLLRTQQMREMITDVLNATRLDSGVKTRKLGAVNVTDVARNAMETVLPEARQRNIALNLAEGDNVVMKNADRSEIQMILNNLLSNAVKYNREGGHVNVDIQRQDGHVRLKVADTGIGMSVEEADTLFSDFTRVRNRKTEHIPGTGLGLSIVKKLAMLYNGDVSVASRPDEGSTFTVTLANGGGVPS